MRVVITGGAGFIGKLLAAKLLERGALTDAAGQVRQISELVLVDIAAAANESWLSDKRVTQVVGDIADRNVLASAVTPNPGSGTPSGHLLHASFQESHSPPPAR